MRILDRLAGVLGSAGEVGEGTPEEKEARQLVATLQDQIAGKTHGWDYEFGEEFAPIVAASEAVQAQVVLLLLSSRKRWGRDARWQWQQPCFTLLNHLLRRKLNFDSKPSTPGSPDRSRPLNPPG